MFFKAYQCQGFLTYQNHSEASSIDQTIFQMLQAVSNLWTIKKALVWIITK